MNVNLKKRLPTQYQTEEISELIKSFFNLIEADFIQLVTDPKRINEVSACQYFVKDHYLPSGFSEKNKAFIKDIVYSSEILLFNKTQLSAEINAHKFFEIESFNFFVFLPLVFSEKRIGVMAIYFVHDNYPSKRFLEYYSREWAFLLMKINKAAAQTREDIAPFLTTLIREMAMVRTRNQFADLFASQLKLLLKFDQSTIFIINRERNQAENFFVELNSINACSFFHDNIDLKKSALDELILQRNFSDPKQENYNFDDLIETTRLTPFLNPEICDVLVDGIVVNIFSGIAIVGKWVLVGENISSENNNAEPLLELIASQIALSITAISAVENFQKSVEKSDVLQGLNLDFSSTRDKNNLLNVINLRLRKFFDFSHNIVGVINEDDLTASTYLTDNYTRARNHPKYGEVTTVKHPLTDGIMNRVILSKEPIVFDLEEQISKGVMPYYLHLMYETGIKKCTISALQVRSKTIGFWFICQLDNQSMTPAQLEMVKSISSQLSAAVESIRANDIIQAKESETERLLKLSFNLTTIRNKADLYAVLNQNLKGLINFDEIVIMLFDDDKSYSNFMLLKASATSDKFIINQYQGKFLLPDSCFSRVIDTGDIQVFDMKNLIGSFQCPEYVKLEYQRGILEKIGISLRGEHDMLGVLFINISNKGAYTDHALRLVRGISYQVSTAIKNIQAGEKIAQRERERDLLLMLSTNIATIKDKAALVGLINKNLRETLGFSHTLMATINNDHKTATAFLVDPESPSKKHPIYSEVIKKQYPINDGILDKVRDSSEPLSFNLLELSEKNNLPEYLLMAYESGISHVVIARLANGEAVFGFWMIFFSSKHFADQLRSNFITGLANQISTALLNIMSNDKIDHRDLVKSSLITFNNAVASVRDRETLCKVLKVQLADLLGISEYIFFLVNDDRITYSPFLFDRKTKLHSNPAFRQMISNGNSINDGLINVTIANLEMQCFGPDELLQIKSPSPIFLLGRSFPQHHLVVTPMSIGDEITGVICTWHQDSCDEADLKLWKSICSPMTIIISNIMSNEKIVIQLEEIRNYKSRLEEEKVYLREEIETSHNYAEIIGESVEMKKIFTLVAQVASSESAVLLLGETGTGKELIARAIHNNSPRKNKLMVKVNCAALPANLIESELFGHERGSFTGATERRLGKFELAHHGTLFLDEIGEMPLELQVKLLRALQEKEIERVGGKGTIKVDVRIIAATNRDLKKEMEEGRFRSDLYFRLNIFPIQLPPLRHRKEDIPLLATHYIQRFSKLAGKKITTISNRVIEELKQYRWPGNVRELEHLIERTILLTSGEILKHIDLPAQSSVTSTSFISVFTVMTADENERLHILETLKYCQGKINGRSGAAALLDIPPSTLHSKMKRLGIKREHIQIINN
ncbi:MAG: sigma 54-interacting transcriptional regulator [Bacteroidota bacterium]|nr:sigma 54-interacting transcriptional regulator [Bacteroidota bacterium]